MNDEFSSQVELTPDLEWLLLSTQTQVDDLLVYLINEYGGYLHLLMESIYDSYIEVNHAVVETLTQIVLMRTGFRSEKNVNVWIYSIALDTAWQMRRKWSERSTFYKEFKNSGLSYIQNDHNFPDWLLFLPEQVRLIIVLRRYMELQPGEIAQIIGESESKIRSVIESLGEVFQCNTVEEKPALTHEQCDSLLQLSRQRFANLKPQGRFRRTALEMSWAAMAILLVALFTRVYDIKNPDPGRQAIEIPFLTPLPASTRNPLPTPTETSLLTQDSESNEIALRYWQRSLNIHTIWEDAFVLLGGSQGGPGGNKVYRVEMGWDVQARELLMLVGPVDGPPVNGLYRNESGDYELSISNGVIIDISVLDKAEPKAWYYIASLPYNLQMNNFEGNVNYRALGNARAAGRDALLVEVINSNGIAEVYTWLDAETAIPLRQQRFADGRGRNLLVLDVIINQISIDTPLPTNYFTIDISENIGFRGLQEEWLTNPQIEVSDRWMEKNHQDRNSYLAGVSSFEPLFYEVKEISNQEGVRYSTSVFTRSGFFGEYPMGNPWSVQCERSPDGNRIAYIEDRRFEFGTVIPSHVLHWFSLDNPGVLETPLPNVQATLFTFSPDGKFLAVHASNEVSLINMGSREIKSLISLSIVDDLVFSPDGKYLGILHSTGQTIYIWIIDLESGELVEDFKMEPDQYWESKFVDILATRKIDFYDSVYFGLENCR